MMAHQKTWFTTLPEHRHQRVNWYWVPERRTRVVAMRTLTSDGRELETILSPR
jgi:hypothetical protein